MSALSTEATETPAAGPVPPPVPPPVPTTASTNQPVADSQSEELQSSGYDVNDDDLGSSLNDAFKKAMCGDFEFSGSYAFGHSAFSAAPNPCLHIEDIGTIGLPLSKRDAQAIIECSAQAPYGQGDKTVVNKDVRDTWEVEPAKIQFENAAAWQSFINKVVLEKVSAALGVGHAAKHLEAELYKLLLYEEGSHFLPHQDTVKTPGMFATIVVVLPSRYTGGQVHVSHSGDRKVYDFASKSGIETAVLAWYTDVRHEVKPITSGYRLALSYNLLQTTPSGPTLSLPDMTAPLTKVRRVLCRWREGRFSKSPDLLAYILNHQYSLMGLRGGFKELKGKDMHRIKQIRRVAEDMGYNIYLANLSYHLSGAADDDGYSYHKRGRWYGEESEDDEATHSMLEVYESSLSISGMVDLDGDNVLDSDLDLEKKCLVPKNPFDGKEPDEEDYEGYMGNGAGSLEHYYRRTVLILIHEKDTRATFLKCDGGLAFALKQLSATATPSADDLELANIIISRMISSQGSIALQMAKHALRWNDFEMWKNVVKASGYDPKVFSVEQLILGWKQFSFDIVRDVLTKLLEKHKGLALQYEFMGKLLNHATNEDRDQVNAWFDDSSSRCHLSMTSATPADVPVLVKVLMQSGPTYLDTSVLPQLTKVTSPSLFSFWVSFLQALSENKTQILASVSQNGDESSHTAAYNELVDNALKAVLPLWEITAAHPSAYNSRLQHLQQRSQQQTPVEKVERAIKIIEICLIHQKPELCRNLCTLMLKTKGAERNSTFQTLHVPFISSLKTLLREKKIDLWSPPFQDILHVFIATYLHSVLKSKADRPKMPTIGCGCRECQAVNTFLQSPRTQTEVFRYGQARRSHLERYLSTIRNTVSYTTIYSGNPHGLQVTKLPHIVAASDFMMRKAATQSFLNGIGDAVIIERIMGSRYPEVLNALEGKAPFALSKPVASAAAPTTKSTTGVSLKSRQRDVPSTAPVDTAIVAGTKRKQPFVDLGVIDLSEDD